MAVVRLRRGGVRHRRAARRRRVRRGVRPWFVLDEGGAIAHEAFPGVAAPIGVIGVTEKGTTSLELRSRPRRPRVDPREDGPHRPAGPRDPAPRALAAAPAHPDPTVELFRRIAPHAPLALRPLLANAGRLRPVLTRALLAAGPETAAMTRTTVAVTTLSGSPAINVIASTAKAGVNIRVMVGDTVAGVLEHVRRAIGDDRVHIDVLDQNEPSPVSPTDDAFALLESTIRELFTDAVPAPYVMMAATDSRHFTEICERVYRFAPFRMTKAQRESIHSYDEHLGIDAFVDGVRWYQRLIERTPMSARSSRPPREQATHGLVAIVGFLVCVELASGILQGYYTPIWQDVANHLGIRDADVNWFEAAQLIVGALVIPFLARLGTSSGTRRCCCSRPRSPRWAGSSRSPVVHHVPDRLRHPGRVRRVAADGGRDHPPPDRRHRSPGAAHPAVGRGARRRWSWRSSSARSRPGRWSSPPR